MYTTYAYMYFYILVYIDGCVHIQVVVRRNQTILISHKPDGGPLAY